MLWLAVSVGLKLSAHDLGVTRLEIFDKGETFAGVDYNIGLLAVEELKKVFGYPENLAPYVLRWILMFDAVSCVIPGESRESHVESNIQASDLEPLSNDQMVQIQEQ